MMAAPRRIAVLGGGITGLAAAYALAQARGRGANVEEYLFEATPRLGGTIRTDHVEGFVVEGGPDSFLAEKPEAATLCRKLGLGNSLLGSNDAERRTYIVQHGRLVPLPEGLALLVPTRVWPILTTPLLSARGKLAIASEWFRKRPSKVTVADESVASFVRRHFGDEVLDNVADPLLSGVFGGDPSALSIRSTLPRFWELAQSHGSLIRGMLEVKRHRHPEEGSDRTRAGATPLFITLRNGLEQMVEELKRHVESSRVFAGQRVVTVRPETGAGGADPTLVYSLRGQDGTTRSVDALILALPAHECGRLVSSFDSTLGEAFKAIPYASAITVALGYEARDCRSVPPGFGFLVPHHEGRKLIACTFVDKKFSFRAPPGKAMFRCFLGGTRGAEVMSLEDHEILVLVREELRRTLRITAQPLFHRIYRWPSSMPQYVVGHQTSVSQIQRRLADHPGIFIAGNAYSGVGISDCIRSGFAAAEGALKYLRC